MPKPDPSLQSASERRKAEADLLELLNELASEHVTLAIAVRKKSRKLLPTAHEMVYEYADFVVSSFTPNGQGKDGVLAVHAGDEGVRLYLSGGKQLPDPDKLLRGTGKQLRWVEIESASTLRRPAVNALIAAAISLNRIPFDSAGKGSVVVQQTTAKKRRAKSGA